MSGQGVDKYMPMGAVTQTMNNLEKKYSAEMEKKTGTVNHTELSAMHSKERFKAMKELDRQNERASPKQIAKRQSMQ